MGDFLSFRKMITPSIIQVIFIIMLVVVWLGALIVGITIMSQGGIAILVGLLVFLVGGVFYTILNRVFCELVMVIFSIHSELIAIRTGAPIGGPGFPVMPSAAQQGMPTNSATTV